MVLGLMEGLDRPCLGGPFLGLCPRTVLVDMGSNVDCRPSLLVSFGALGSAFSKYFLGIPEPRVGLLSVGSEEAKGNRSVQESFQLFQDSHLNFVGNVEGMDFFTDRADVIVCDGFTGNVALKVSEGLVEVVEDLLRDELNRTFTTQLGYLLSRRSYRRFRRRVDYSEYGGAPLLGVAGLAVVGHGRSSIKAVRNALALTYRFVSEGFVKSIDESMTSFSAERKH